MTGKTDMWDNRHRSEWPWKLEVDGSKNEECKMSYTDAVGGEAVKWNTNT